MLNILSPLAEDSAGQSHPSPDYFQTQQRIRSLIDKYLAVEKLHDRLQDLPMQFQNPQPRPWKLIDWQTINRDRIIGIKPEVFLKSTLLFTFTYTMRRLWTWNNTLTPKYLQTLFE